MARPQLENGHIRIANEIWDHLLLADLGSVEWSCLGVVIRETWGWTRKEAHISLSKFRELTARPVDSVRSALVTLQRKNIVLQTKRPGFRKAAQWSINKDWETWKVRGGVKPHSPLKTPLSLKNTIPEGGENTTPQSAQNPTLHFQNGNESASTQGDGQAWKLQTTNLQPTTTKRRGGEKAADPRFAPLLEYFSKHFAHCRSHDFIAHPKDHEDLRRMLRRAPGLEIATVEAAIIRFLESWDPFYLRMGKPLSFFSNNITAFLHEQEASRPARVPDLVGGEPADAKNLLTPEEIQKTVEERRKKEMESLAREIEKQRRKLG
jgi:phage replication O-like protein O